MPTLHQLPELKKSFISQEVKTLATEIEKMTALKLLFFEAIVFVDPL